MSEKEKGKELHATKSSIHLKTQTSIYGQTIGGVYMWQKANPLEGNDNLHWGGNKRNSRCVKAGSYHKNFGGKMKRYKEL